MSSSDNILLITAGYDRTIRFWHANTAAIYRTIMHEDSPTNCLAIHPQKTLLAAGSYQHIKMYDLMSNNPNPVMKLDQLQKNIVTLGFSDERHFMFSGGEDHCVRIWDMRAAKTKAHRQISVGAAVNCVTLHPNQV
jgi:G protein beta subunit-like protein